MDEQGFLNRFDFISVHPFIPVNFFYVLKKARK